MGGDFSSRGQQDCAKGIYALAGSLYYTVLGEKRTPRHRAIKMSNLNGYE